MKISHLLPALLLATAIDASAQKSTSYLESPGGRTVTNSKYQHIIGSPFVFDDWLPGEVVTAAGKVHTGMLLKYNIETDVLTFVYDPKEEPLKFAEPITAFTLLGEKRMSFANTFPQVYGRGKATYYEVLVSGKTMLLKHYKQFLKETLNTSLSKTDATYVQSAAYYIFNGDKMIPIKPNAKDVLKTLADKSAQVDSFLVAEHITFENEESLKKVLDYYNTL